MCRCLNISIFLMSIVLSPLSYGYITEYMAWSSPIPGDWHDPNNWSSGHIPTVGPEFAYGDHVTVGTFYSGGSSFGHAVISENTQAYMLTVGAHLQGYGILDILPGVTLDVGTFLSADDTPDSVGVVNVYGNVNASYAGQWSCLGRGGLFYWNQYSGNTVFFMNYWAESVSSELYVNVSGGWFEAGYKPVAKRGKVYINVSGTGVVKMEAWTDAVYPRPGGGTWFTLNGAGKLIVYGDWTADPTLGGLLSSDSSVIAVLSTEYAGYTELTTDACGPIVAGDLNKNCVVDIVDLLLLVQNWLD